jgi:uncharacterized protein YecT (DUF1311 family)
MCTLVLCLYAASAEAAPLSAEREESFYSPGYEHCLAITHGLRPREHCTAQEIEFQRNALEDRYTTLRNASHGRARQRLTDGQQSWQSRMDARCTVFSRRRGSLNSVKAQDCFLSETIARRAELDHIAR